MPTPIQEDSLVKRSFSRWRAWTGIIVCLSVSGWMIFRSINEPRFYQVERDKGDFIWFDKNHDGKVDLTNPSEFYPSKAGNYRKENIDDAFNAVNWSIHTIVWMTIALLFVVARDYFYIVRIRLLTNKQLDWRSGFNVIMLWEFASALSPGVIGGTGVAMFILAKEKIAIGRATAVVMVTALLDNLFFVLLIPIVILSIDSTQLFPADTFAQGVYYLFWVGYTFFLVLSILLLILLFRFPEAGKKCLFYLSNRKFFRRWEGILKQAGEDLVTTAYELKKHTWLFWLKSFAATCASWLSRYFVINALMHALLRTPWNKDMLILGKQAVLWLLMRVSPTPGGSGVAEYAFSSLLQDLGYSAMLLALLALIWRIIAYFPYLIIGSLLLPRWLGRKA